MEEATVRKSKGFSHPRPLNHIFKVVGDIAVSLEEIGFVLLIKRNQCLWSYHTQYCYQKDARGESLLPDELSAYLSLAKP